MRLILPKNKHDLVDAINAEMLPAEQEAMVHLTMWKWIDSYIAGARRFKILDRWSGQFSQAFENSKGELDLRYEEITRLYLAEVGRYLKMDNSPVVTRKGDHLSALRDAGISNAVLGATTARIPLKQIQRKAIIPFLKYGTVGLNHVETGNKSNPDLIEVVTPRQLRGWPAWVDGTENLYATCRRRWVPLDWAAERVKMVYNKQLPLSQAVSKLGARSTPYGSVPPEHAILDEGQASAAAVFRPVPDNQIGTNIGGDKSYEDTGKASKEGRYYVPLEEIYVYDDSQMFVSRFIIKIGDFIVHDMNFEESGLQVLCPLHIARHTDTGKFFSRGFLAPLIPLNDQAEKMFASLFKNVQEYDQFGTLFVPGASGIDLKKWRTGPRPKVEKFEPDPINPRLQPFVLQPSNSGTMPAQVSQIVVQEMARMSGQGPIYQGQASGRVDSAAGLGFLFNTGNIALGLPANGIADAFAGIFSRILQVTKDRMAPGDTIKIATVDDAIAGVVLDPESGELTLANNPIPEPWTVNIDVKDRTPRDRDIRKQELLDLHQRQLVDDINFWVTAYLENLDFPGVPKEVVETWRKATWQIIMLFRDGKTPGTVDVGEHTQNPDIQLKAVQGFMNRLEFSLASPAVRKAFEDWKVSLEILAGVHFPAGLPSPEMIAPGQQPGMPTGMNPQMMGGGPPV